MSARTRPDDFHYDLGDRERSNSMMRRSMRGHTITESVQLVTETCCSCHVLFAITEAQRDELLETHGSFYCPNGHGQRYTGKTDAEKQRERAERAEVRAAALNDQLAASERSKAAIKGQLTKAKKRIGNGTCPCCSRHFTNVERHMQTKHPEYAAEVGLSRVCKACGHVESSHGTSSCACPAFVAT